MQIFHANSLKSGVDAVLKNDAIKMHLKNTIPKHCSHENVKKASVGEVKNSCNVQST